MHKKVPRDSRTNIHNLFKLIYDDDYVCWRIIRDDLNVMRDIF